MYRCKYCRKEVRDRHKHYHDACKYSPDGFHHFEHFSDGIADIENDTYFSESYVGKFTNWLWKSSTGKTILFIVAVYILIKILS